MNQETALYIQSLNRAYDIRIEITPECPSYKHPLIIVDELELAIFKKHIIMALKEKDKVYEQINESETHLTQGPYMIKGGDIDKKTGLRLK